MPTTPRAAAANELSRSRMRADGNGLRTNATCTTPARRLMRSSTYPPAPISRRWSSLRRRCWPIACAPPAMIESVPVVNRREQGASRRDIPDVRGAQYPIEVVSHRLSATRRQLLKNLVLLGAGTVAVACSPAGAPVAPTQAAAPAASNWDTLLATARSEAKVVVSGPPDPGASTQIPDAFKQFSGIDLEYLAGNSSQLASRIQSERAAGQYTIDVSLSGADTVYGTFLANGWLDPLKPVLILPDVVDGKLYRTGEPWFRDPDKRIIMQLFNTASPRLLTLNTQLVTPEELKDSSSLVDPKWQGKICAYDPGVHGAGI